MLTKLYISLIRLGIGLIILLACYPTEAFAASASNNTVQVKTDTPNGPIDQYVAYYLEQSAELSLDDVSALVFHDKFKPVETSAADFGYYDRGMWLKIPIHNMSDITQERLLILHTNFMPEMNIYWVTNTGAEVLLEQDRHSKFSSRTIAYHQIVAPLTINGQQSGDIYIRYTSEGNTVLPISLETAVSFARTTNNRVTIDFAFYGIMAMFVFASIIGRLFWNNPTFIAYSFYAASVLLFIFQRDGYAFQYLWPDAPEWNTFSSLPIGGALSIFAAIFTRAYLNTKRIHPIIDKLLIGVVVMQVSIIFSFVIIGPSAAKKIALITTTISIVVFCLIGVAAYRKYGRRTLFFLVGWAGILCASLIMTLVHWVNLDLSRAQSLDLMRIAMVFDALMMGLASVFSIVELQRDREKLDRERIAVLNANLDLHNRFGRLEQKYHLAQTLAETNSQLLVDTTHDLRQPIYALRAAMGDALSEKVPAVERVAEIKQSLNYIEELVEAALEKAIEEDETSKSSSRGDEEVTDANKLFSALETMFEADARQGSVEFKTMPTTQRIHIPPFPALRIMTNFISNAIRYCPNSRVLVGARRKGNTLSLEVHDTGPGISPEELAEVKQRHTRGNTSNEGDTGKGVGLSIVSKLAQKHNLDWTLSSRKGYGTIAKLIVPVAYD